MKEITQKQTTRSSADIIENTLRPYDVWEINRYQQSKALGLAIAEARKDLSFSMESSLWSFETELGEIANDLTVRAASSVGHRLAALLAAQDVLNHCPDLPAIKAQLDPIFKELEQARECETKEAAAQLKAKCALEAARQSAGQRLVAEVENDPAVVEAAKLVHELAKLTSIRLSR